MNGALISMLLAASTAVPPTLAVDPGLKLVLKAHATGVQIYRCGVKKDAPGMYEWTLKAPEAKLFDEKGAEIGKHYGGPTWELKDGSKVVGAMKAKVDSPDAGSIPWLLVDAKSTEGNGKLSKVKSIQRLDTRGGKASGDVRCGARERRDAHRLHRGLQLLRGVNAVASEGARGFTVNTPHGFPLRTGPARPRRLR